MSACILFCCVYCLRSQDGRSVEVCNSFEMNYKVVDGAIKIDMDYFEIKLEQCASIIPLAIFLSPEPLSPRNAQTSHVSAHVFSPFHAHVKLGH